MTEEHKDYILEKRREQEAIGYKYKKMELLSAPNLALLATTGAVTISGLVLNDLYLLGLGTGLLAAESARLFKVVRDSKIYAGKIEMGLHERHPDYGQTKNDYYKFMGNLAEFIKGYGLEDPLDIGMFYQLLLNEGFLSVNGEFEYYNYEDGEDYDIHGTMDGARIFSGRAVCRHIGKSLIDLYNAMGIVAAPMLVKGYDKKSIFLKAAPFLGVFNNLDIDHLNVAVTSEKGKFIIDPTWWTVAEFGYKGYANDNLANIVFSKEPYNSDCVYYISSNSYKLNDNLYMNDNYMGGMILCNSPRKFEVDEIEQSLSRVTALFNSDIDRIIRFRNENIGLIMSGYKGEKHISFNSNDTIDEPLIVTEPVESIEAYQNIKRRNRFYDESDFN